MTQEEWRPVLGWEDLYEVSDAGRVRNIGRGPGRQYGRILVSRSIAGYQLVTLSRDRKQKHRSVHSLVLEAFVGPRPEGMEGCHENDVPWDNRLSNLKWGTHSENIKASRTPRLTFWERIELIKQGA